MIEFEFRKEDYVCTNCKYYGCDRSKNCETICDKWTISEFVLEELLEEHENPVNSKINYNLD